MKYKEKFEFLAIWSAKNGFRLELKGECGFGRKCVGIIRNGVYPSYQWHKSWERVDANGNVWIPPDAYHKHPCVAVLGRGQKAFNQLYDWVKWFHDNNFKLQIVQVKNPHPTIVDAMLGKLEEVRLVKQQPNQRK